MEHVNFEIVPKLAGIGTYLALEGIRTNKAQFTGQRKTEQGITWREKSQDRTSHQRLNVAARIQTLVIPRAFSQESKRGDPKKTQRCFQNKAAQQTDSRTENGNCYLQRHVCRRAAAAARRHCATVLGRESRARLSIGSEAETLT